MGRAMLSKSLIQFSVDGWSCLPSLLFTWGQTMVEVMKIMATSFKRSHVHIATLERQPSSTGAVAAGCWSDFEEISHVQVQRNPSKTVGREKSRLESNPTHTKEAQFSSVAQSCPTLCDPMNCSMPGLPAHHQLPECTQTHVHQVSDAIQPSHPLSSPSPPALNLSQHQCLFK